MNASCAGDRRDVRSGHRAVVLSLLLASSGGGLAGLGTQAPASAAGEVVVRAGRYVEQYERAFGAIVCEERQIQTLIRADGSIARQRTLTSDFLLIELGGPGSLAFRDVIEVDGKPVRDRDERLRKLFLEKPRTAVDQAQAIARESGRYNIGVGRSPNSPLLPLQFLHPRVAPRMRFALAGSVLTFEEFGSPTIVRQKRFGHTRDMPSHGSFAVEPETGRVLSAQVAAGAPGAAYDVAYSVKYADDAATGLFVPVAMTERITRRDKPRDDRLEVASSYSRFRRFQVTTEERIKPPR